MYKKTVFYNTNLLINILSDKFTDTLVLFCTVFFLVNIVNHNKFFFKMVMRVLG